MKNQTTRKKLTSIFLIFFLLGMSSPPIWATPILPILELQNRPLSEALDELGEKYHVFISYQTNLVKDVIVDFEFKESESLEQAVNRLLIQTHLRYEFYEKQYIIIYDNNQKGRKDAKRVQKKIKQIKRLEEKGNLSLQRNSQNPLIRNTTILQSAIQQRREQTISGMISDEAENPLQGATVRGKGTKVGAITSEEGKFQITLPDEATTLIISYLGYATQEIEIGGRTTIDVKMAESVSELDEVVLVGYGTVRKSDLTGAVGSLDASKFEDEVISNVSQGLQGKVAGVNVTMNGGAPGGNMIVRIRGNNSVIGSNDPLYVVDGFPITSGNVGETNLLSTINPGDIESIEVLKDASATAIYGSRGSNGVILITTKQGKTGTDRVDFESSIGFRTVEKTIDMMNSAQYMEIANERLINDRNDPYFSTQDIATLSQTNTDWQDEIFRSALVQNHSLRFSGGNATTRYLISGNYFNEEGIIIGSDFQRGSLRANLDKDFGERFTLSTRLMLSRGINNEINDEDVLLSALQAPPFFTPFKEDGTYMSAAELKPFPFSPSTGDNPVALAKEQLDERVIDRVLANVSGNFEIFEGLTAKVLLGVDQLTNERNFYNPRVLERGLPAGSGSKSFSSTTSFLNENTLNYNTTLRENDRLDVTVGFTWQQEQNDILFGSASGFVTDDLQNEVLGSGEFFAAPNTSFSEWTLLSFLGRVNYSVNGRYLFTLSGRRDGSSRFGEGNKWGFFPSAAAAWRMSEEGFIRDNFSVVSDMKLRASWGISGNQAISPYQSLQRFSDIGLAFGGATTTGFVAANLGNPDLKWETTEEFNVGLELGLWNQRFTFSADYYSKDTKDLLALVNLPPTAGFSTTIQNIGSTRNNGVEFNLGTYLISQENMQWDVNVNLAHNRNEVTETSSGQDIIAPGIGINGPGNVVREGEPLSSFFGLATDGLTEDGLFNFIDQNGDGQINDADRVILGNPYPDFFYGLGTAFTYGNLSIRLNIQGAIGGEIWNDNKYRVAASFHRASNAIAEVVNERWSPSNQNQNAPFPRASNTLNQRPSDWYIEDASYLRLQNLRINYDIPLETLNIEGIRTLSVYFSGQNLITLTNYSWYTPDINTHSSGDLRIGVDRLAYPTARTFLFGVKLGL